MSISDNIWSTPDVVIYMTPGVLQMYDSRGHLECFQLRAHGLNDYSICLNFNDIWSAPDVVINMTSEVLQMSSGERHLE